VDAYPNFSEFIEMATLFDGGDRMYFRRTTRVFRGLLVEKTGHGCWSMAGAIPESGMSGGLGGL
jgi:hypothetical protein